MSRLSGPLDIPRCQHCRRATVPMLEVLSVTQRRPTGSGRTKSRQGHSPAQQGVIALTWHHQPSEFERFGYFPGRQWSEQDPLRFLVAPCLRLHPATETLLAWTSMGVAETMEARSKGAFSQTARELGPKTGDRLDRK
jgi:hypothetical protein